jgi:hypothetical protein
VVVDSEPFGALHGALPDLPEGGHALHFNREPQVRRA